MRIILSGITLTTIALFTSCHEYYDIDSIEYVASRSISIEVTQLDTRGSLAVDDASAVSVGLYCAMTGEASWSSSTEFTKLKNRKYYYSKDDNQWLNEGDPESWAYSNIDYKYTFFAYSPYAANNGITPSIVDGELSIEYTVPTTCTEQPDLLIAIPHKNIVAPEDGYITLDCYHALSAIYFKVKNNCNTKIKEIEVSGVTNSGTLTWDYEDEVPLWNLSNGANNRGSFTVSIDDYISNSDTEVQITSEDCYLMMIPQRLKPFATISITLDNGEEHSLSLSRNTTWSAGEQYCYIIDMEETRD